MSYTSRVVVLVDMDCFYCQVEEKLNPSLKGKPLAVVQYNDWQGGGIIAVNYLARDKGVTRHMRGDEARKTCPQIQLVKVPQVRGKADLTKYRDAGKHVADVLQTFTALLERASVDEAYLDITEVVNKRIVEGNCEVTLRNLKNTFVVGSSVTDFVENVKFAKTYNESLFKLAVGGVIAEEVRAEVFNVTGYQCSAGIAHNKILAKLVCGLHKPNKQTILPQESVPELYSNMPVKKIKSLGGKFGVAVSEQLGIVNMGELTKFSEKELSNLFDEKSANWLYNIARGIDMEPVNTRLVAKSIGCSKNFPGRTALVSEQDLEHWCGELAGELSERLQKDFQENNRKAKLLTVHFSQGSKSKGVSSSRSCPFNSYDHFKITQKVLQILRKNCHVDTKGYRITHLGINMGNFEDVKNVREITSFFKTTEQNQAKLKENKATEQGTDSDEQDSSIFSRSTLDDDQYRENLVYYEEVEPDSILDQNVSATSADSISPELFSVDDDDPPPSTSFFKKYFSENVTPDFNTSKCFEDETSEAVKIIKSNETCPDCGKTIPISEFPSHMDYHFALKIVKDEAHLYKASGGKIVPQSPKKVKEPTSRKNKRKSNEIEGKPILDFLKKNSEDNNEGNSKLCSECNKKIKLADVASHADYHAAKMLHQQINGKISSPLKSRKRGFKSKNGNMDISTFLRKC